MDVDVQQRRVRLSVGELADFRSGPREGAHGRTGRWRLEAGVAWHREMQEQVTRERAAAGDAEGRYEVPIAAAWVHDGWHIDLQGRIDQVLGVTGRTVMREIKTVRRPLPEREDILRQDYSAYFAQAATYQVMAGLLPEYGGQTVAAELMFIDIGSGATQCVGLEADARGLFESQVRVLWDFLEARRSARERLDSARFAEPFSDLRPGQEHVDEALLRAAGTARVLAFEAPTGFGKTAYALHFALQQVKQRAVDRLVYLTGKSTGQLQVVNELERRWPGCLRYHQMRSKQEHAIRSPMHSCDDYGGGCRAGIEDRWLRAGIRPAQLVAAGPLTLQEVRSMGERTGVCPYEISRAVLPFADLWIGDYNYIFHPRSSGVFRYQPGFDPAHTLLLVDEAHNLPARVADAWSAGFDARRIGELGIELSFAGVPHPLQRALENLQHHVQRQRPSLRLDLSDQYVLRDLLGDLAEQMHATPLDPELLRPGALEGLWELVDALLPLEHEHLDLLLWAPENGVLRITCLDASHETSAQLREFGQVMLLSATLRPLPEFVESLGLAPAEVGHVAAQAPWRAEAYDVAVDCRVDTRFRTRVRHLGDTAETVIALRNAAAGPVAVLFPSYKYAQDIANVLLTLDPGLRIALQPRGADLAGQRVFVEESLLVSDILMLVMGSGFTEGIDALGGRLSHAMVVSPGLPEADAVQAARLEQLGHLPGGQAFHRVYQVPGMRKVNQALGRLVRAPGQNAKVLLHCRRFAESSFQSLLDDDFQPRATIRKQEDLDLWLNG